MKIKQPNPLLLLDLSALSGGQVSIGEMTPDPSWAAYVASMQARSTAAGARAQR